MNTEIIKFRAWNGVSFTYWTMNDLCSWGDKDEKPSPMDEWLQYTGQKDRDGTEIYEGDIISFDHKASGGEINHEVVWENGGFMLKGTRYFVGGNTDFLRKVVGNIYENHELLK